MKRILGIAAAVVLFAGVVYAQQFNAVEKAGDMTVKVAIENSPLKVGDNNASIEVLDSSENAVTDADVTVSLFMPSMPAMQYEVPASRSGSGYAAVIKPTMPGAWQADIKVTPAGGSAHKATVTFDAQ